MSFLNDIIGKVETVGTCDWEWPFLHQHYFKEGNGWDDLKSWADKNNLSFTTRTEPTEPDKRVSASQTIITFRRKPSP